ncbi:hypothetical protein HWV62_26702 [Athelia sp. TMB]|nr:hypothetical protein HWV62_26702 [Athelia sp. TMB]
MGGTYTEKLEGTQRELGSYFDKSATVVRSKFQWFENKYAQPLIAFSLDTFDTHPFVATFFAIFAALALLPVVAFLGVTVCTIAGVSFLFFVIAVVTIILLQILFVVILLSTLTILAIVALISTPLAISTYVFYRLVVYLRRTGPAGLPSWFSEMKVLFLGGAVKLHNSHMKVVEASEGSDVSGDGVLVDGKGVNVEGK